MPTNADLQHLINDLSKRVTAIEGRMKTYEEQTLENTLILKRVEATVKGYETSIKSFLDFLKRLLKWVVGVVTGILILAAGGLIVAYISAHYIH